MRNPFITFFANIAGEYKTQNILIVTLHLIAFTITYYFYGLPLLLVILALDFANSFHLVQLLRPARYPAPQPGNPYGDTSEFVEDNPFEENPVEINL